MLPVPGELLVEWPARISVKPGVIPIARFILINQDWRKLLSVVTRQAALLCRGQIFAGLAGRPSRLVSNSDDS